MSRSRTSVRRMYRSLAKVALVWIGIQIGAPFQGQAAAAGKAGTVRGVALNSDHSPIPGARVRLRNTQTGRIEVKGVAGEDGRFVFNARGGSYIAELVDDNGRVLAVGPVFRVGPEETVDTFVRLASRRPWFATVFSNAATAVIAAASTAGVTALGPSGHGSRPISPQ